MDYQIDISLPIEEIIKRKIEFHLEQVGIHNKAIETLKSQFGVQGSIYQNTTILPVENKTITKDNFGVIFASQKSLKPLILNLLNEEEGKGVTTAYVYQRIFDQAGKEDTTRTAWIAAISQSFNSLYLAGKIEKKPLDGEKGNRYFLRRREEIKSSEMEDLSS